ncbi:alcohol acetyltransferase [Mycena alexandri]|uniref:Alcohol acetyltransferase n=1 Tax=Mycena alexandri TaxID=1745969 RepID=A0AAD6WM84_9AGAR|nr:alcohol acetyltransferase [Mycena alexandri]
MSPLRPVGLFEQYHQVRHFLGLDSCVVVSARYVSADGASLNKEHLFPALRKVVATHRALSVKLQGENSRQSAFINLETIDLSLLAQFSDHDDLETAIKGQLLRRFDTDSELPLWRVEVLRDGTVVLAYHHVIGDGLSGVAFHQSLLAALQDVIAGDDSSLVTVPQSLSLLPPMEAVTNLRPSILKVIKEVLALFLPTSWTAVSSAWTANPVPKTPEIKPGVKLITLTREEMASFAATCRSHGATLTSAFYVLAVATISRLVPPNTPQYKTLSAFVAVSMRTATAAPADVMCDYVAAHHTYPAVHPAFQWPAAALYAAELQRQKYAAREEVGMLYLLFGNVAPFFRGMLGKKRGGTFEISNAGRVPAGKHVGPWRIERMVFAQSDLVVGAALKINVIGDPTGAVNIALTWGKDAIDEALVESFAAQFQDGLRALIV